MLKLVTEGLLSPTVRFEREWSVSFLQYCNMSSSHRPVEGSGLATGSTPRDGGLPKRISKGLMYTLDLFDLSVPFSHSTAPPLAGWYAQCCLKSVARNSLIWVVAELTKCEPLSLLSFVGIPHLGMISVNRAFATTWLLCTFSFCWRQFYEIHHQMFKWSVWWWVSTVCDCFGFTCIVCCTNHT